MHCFKNSIECCSQLDRKYIWNLKFVYNFFAYNWRIRIEIHSVDKITITEETLRVELILMKVMGASSGYMMTLGKKKNNGLHYCLIRKCDVTYVIQIIWRIWSHRFFGGKITRYRTHDPSQRNINWSIAWDTVIQ